VFPPPTRRAATVELVRTKWIAWSLFDTNCQTRPDAVKRRARQPVQPRLQEPRSPRAHHLTRHPGPRRRLPSPPWSWDPPGRKFLTQDTSRQFRTYRSLKRISVSRQLPAIPVRGTARGKVERPTVSHQPHLSTLQEY
jgi:hypothetical protein